MKTKFVLPLALALTLIVYTAASAAGVGQACGGASKVSCGEGMFCQFLAGQCGFYDLQGTCTLKSKSCPELKKADVPICACDGRTFQNDCERLRAGVSLAHKGKCQ